MERGSWSVYSKAQTKRDLKCSNVFGSYVSGCGNHHRFRGSKYHSDCEIRLEERMLGSLGMVVYTQNLRTWDAEAGGLQV